MIYPALEKAIREAGLNVLEPEALAKFQTYLNLLLKWNSRLNLTAIREPEGILHRHFVECIQCAQALPISGAESTVLDFGSGAGLPGVPIAICRPELRVTLAESQQKKSAFLREVVRSLGLQAEVFDGRAEAMDKDRIFDVVTLRAVDRMVGACRSGLQRLESSGWLAVFSTETLVPELRAFLPEIVWRQELRTTEMDHGIILFGQRN